MIAWMVYSLIVAGLLTLAAEALRGNNESFLQLARAQLGEVALDPAPAGQERRRHHQRIGRIHGPRLFRRVGGARGDIEPSYQGPPAEGRAPSPALRGPGGT